MFNLIALQSIIAEQKIAVKTLAAKADVDYNTLVKILHAKRTPTLVTIGKLAAALNISPKELLKEV